MLEETDEYQLQVPDKLVRWKKFDTTINNGETVKKVLADVKDSKKKKSKGKEYKTANEMLVEYNITMDQLKSAIKAEKDAEDLSNEKFLLSGNTYVFEDGKIGRSYSRAGELMTHAIEEAYVELGFRVPITGEYLVADREDGWAGAH